MMDSGDDHTGDYSFAIEYSGPSVSYDIPMIVPVDVRRIPTAEVATTVSNLSLPIIQPIVGKSLTNPSRVYSRKTEDLGESEGAKSSSSSLGFSDGNELSYSSDVEDLDDYNKTIIDVKDSVELDEVSISNQAHNRTPVVTFRDLPDSTSESDCDESETIPEKPVADDVKKGVCYKCHKRNRFKEKEVCIVCGAKYCSKCLLRAMGTMPEGRKCITCIGFGIHEPRRGSLGKPSRMLKKLLTDDGVKQVMNWEVSCGVNQLPPYRICVNGKPLSVEELVMLKTCSNPPKKLKPGHYWYDKVSGFWGKDGEKPCQIITAQLAVGDQIRKSASNGNTNVMINNREITKQEVWMLEAASINCEGSPHFWVTDDGSCQLEGMNFVIGKLWEKKRVRLICAALSLPFPSDTSNRDGEDTDEESDNVNTKNSDEKTMNKLLLVGCDRSGTSTIYKQARILYNVPFLEDEKQRIKILIQRNLYRYIVILLDARERFHEEYAIELRRRYLDEPGPSDVTNQVREMSVYSFSPRLEHFSASLLQIMISGSLEAIFPAATREYSLLVEELWKDKGFQAVYKRRNELHTLPRVANYFLDRAVEISWVDYEPSEMDILYAEGVTSSNGVVSTEFSFPKLTRDEYMESSDQEESIYQLIRVHASNLGKNLKWLEKFEDVDLILFCVSLTDYDEYYEDITGVRTNKMSLSRKLFESIISHPTLSNKHFLLILNKFDLLEEKLKLTPLTHCDWFQDFKPVNGSNNSNNNNNNNPQMAQRAFHYVAVKFKRIFESMTGGKLSVVRGSGLEGDSVNEVLRYGKEILKWEDEKHDYSSTGNDYWSSESIDPPSTSA